jgi:hypothetical protein
MHQLLKILMVLVVVGLASCKSGTTRERELALIWTSNDASAKERCDAINRCFTNGTPIVRVVGTLGNNYTLVIPYSGITSPGGRLTRGLLYELGDGRQISIGTTAALDENEMAANFTGAGVLQSLPLSESEKRMTNANHERQPEH